MEFIKHGADKVPRLSLEAATNATALSLSPRPSRWDWRQRATSRVLARMGVGAIPSPSTSHRISNNGTAHHPQYAARPSPLQTDALPSSMHVQDPGPSSGVQSVAAPPHPPSYPSPISAWADFGKTIPAQLRQLPHRIMPPQSLLLLGAAASLAERLPADAQTTTKKTRRRTRATKADSTATKASTKGKGKAKKEEAAPVLLSVEDQELLEALRQHHLERSELLLPTIRAYAARLSTLLDHERDAKRRELDLRQAKPVAKLVEQGIAIDGLQAYWQGADQPAPSKSSSKRKKTTTTTAAAAAQSASRRTAIFKLPAGRMMEWNRFKVGDKVELSHGTGALFLDAFESANAQGSAAFGLSESQLDTAAVPPSARKVDTDAVSGQSLSVQSLLTAAPSKPVGTILEKTPFRLRVLFDLSKLQGSAPLTNGSAKTHMVPAGPNQNLEANLENCTSWRLDLGENNMAEIRMRDALVALEHDIDFLERLALSDALPSESRPAAAPIATQPTDLEDFEDAWIRSMTQPAFPIPKRSEYVLSGCKVLDTLLNVPSPSLRKLASPAPELEKAASKARSRKEVSASTTFDADCRIRSWASRYDRAEPLVIDGDPDLGGLNASQVRAIAMMLRNRVSLVQGPPGTGKTRTIVETIRLLKQHFEVPQPILLTAHTNVAVDNLAEGCRQAGLRVVRAGSSPKAAAGTAADQLQAEISAAGNATRVIDAGSSAVSAGRLARPELIDCTLDNLMAKHPSKPDLDALTGRLTAARVRLGEMYATLEHAGRSVSIVTDAGEYAVTEQDAVVPIMPSETNPIVAKAGSAKAIPKPADVAAARKQVARLARRVFLQTQVILSHILHSADVVCTTALSATSTSLRSIDFPIVFFDEGSMATETVALVPLMKGCEHLAIIGDHRQLPPVVSSSAARSGGLSLSLFERLMGVDGTKAAKAVDGDADSKAETRQGAATVPNSMLTVQHRMHPSLSAFSNRTFYDGALQDGARTNHLPPLQTGFSSDLASPYTAFLSHTMPEEKVDNSLQNSGEARMACDMVASLLLRNPALKGSEVGIVTPYVAQVLLLGRMLRADLGGGMRQRMEQILAKLDDASRKQIEDGLKEAGTTIADRAKEGLEVEVHTVDGFEGREKAAIVFSTVRTNPSGYVGFLADGRRLNVALTRAQRGLFLLGNIKTWERATLGETGDREMERSDVGILKSFAAHLHETKAVLSVDPKTLVL